MEKDIVRWKETYELSFELSDVVFVLLDNLLDYCKTNNIPLYKEQSIWNLVSKAQALINEIGVINTHQFSSANRRKVTRSETDEDETESSYRLRQA